MKTFFGLRLKSRRAVATVVGAVFFFAIAIALVSFLYEVFEMEAAMEEFDAQKAREKVEFELQVLPGGGLLLRIKNLCSIPVEIIRVWVIDVTENRHIPYPQDISQRLSIKVAPWGNVTVSSTEAPLSESWVPLEEKHTYIVKIVTSRGNIIEQRPIRGAPGQTTLPTNYPPWVSTAEADFSMDPSETPVPQISRDDTGRPYDGGPDVWLSIKNTGTVTFFLTFDSKLVFKSVTDGRVYAGRLTRWETFTWDAKKRVWVKEDEGPVSPDKDSLAVYPGKVIVLRFDKPQEAPGYSTPAPRGTYAVYLHIEGYDENGKTFFQDVYYGEISF